MLIQANKTEARAKVILRQARLTAILKWYAARIKRIMLKEIKIKGKSTSKLNCKKCQPRDQVYLTKIMKKLFICQIMRNNNKSRKWKTVACQT